MTVSASSCPPSWRARARNPGWRGEEGWWGFGVGGHSKVQEPHVHRPPPHTSIATRTSTKDFRKEGRLRSDKVSFLLLPTTSNSSSSPSPTSSSSSTPSSPAVSLKP